MYYGIHLLIYVYISCMYIHAAGYKDLDYTADFAAGRLCTLDPTWFILMVLCQTSVVLLSPASLAPACAGVPPAVYAPSLQSPSSTSAPTPAGYVPLSQADSQPIQPTSTYIMYMYIRYEHLHPVEC